MAIATSALGVANRNVRTSEYSHLATLFARNKCIQSHLHARQIRLQHLSQKRLVVTDSPFCITIINLPFHDKITDMINPSKSRIMIAIPTYRCAPQFIRVLNEIGKKPLNHIEELAKPLKKSGYGNYPAGL